MLEYGTFTSGNEHCNRSYVVIYDHYKSLKRRERETHIIMKKLGKTYERANTSSRRNKYGLKRYIPENIKREIRRNSGFGCVVCGAAIYEYEHVNPPFSEAKEHSPSNMTLLCPTCHSKVTKKVFSKKKIEQAMKEPWSIKEGFSFENIDNDDRSIFIGNNEFHDAQNIIVLRKKPLFYVEYLDKDGPPLITMTFHNENDSIFAEIKQNLFLLHSNTAGMDFKNQGSNLSISFKNKKSCLEIERMGGQSIKIISLKSYYKGYCLEISQNGTFKVVTPEGMRFEMKNSTVSGGKTVFSFG